ncbi:MAG: AAA family ATPase [Myxococcota bacterium]
MIADSYGNRWPPTPPRLDHVAPTVPAVVADIVARLLNKSADARYQTARGLERDLRRCLEAAPDATSLPRFTLGERDFSPRLRIPEELVGRERPLAQLAAHLDQARDGSVQVVMLGGPSGVGKTAVVRQLYRSLAGGGGGLLLSGKYDQVARATPYSALAQAFGELCDKLASLPEPKLATWREQLRESVGHNLRLIVDAVPQLTWIMGPLPDVRPLPPDQSANRLKNAWFQFVKAVTRADAPLVLFLDDLQWMDLASMELLKLVFTDVDTSHALLIGAYRDDEVAPDHLMWRLVGALEQSKASVSRITLPSLDLVQVTTWFERVLGTTSTAVSTLAEAVFRKTQGSPFYMGQITIDLHRKGQLRRDLTSGGWSWDQGEVESLMALGDNVVTLLRNRLAELETSTQELLGLAACHDHMFSLGDLMVLADQSAQASAAALWPALESGLLLAVDHECREALAVAETNRDPLTARYRFVHDQVQKACYEHIPADRREVAHLDIGRRLRARHERDGSSTREMIDMMRHLNLGAASMTNEDERRGIAQLNLEACRRGKASAVYAQIVDLAQAGQRWIADEEFEGDLHELWAALELEHAEAEYFLRSFEACDARLDALLTRPLPPTLYWAARELSMRSLGISGRYHRGVELGLTLLRELGRPVPENAERAGERAFALLEEMMAWRDAHEDRDPFATMGVEVEPVSLLESALIGHFIMCAGFSGQPVYGAWATLSLMRETADRQVVSPVTPLIMSFYADAMSSITSRYARGRWWTDRAVALAERIESPAVAEAKAIDVTYRLHHEPARELIDAAHAASDVSVATGSFFACGWSEVLAALCCQLWAGIPLPRIRFDLETRQGRILRATDRSNQGALEMIDALARRLSGSATGLAHAPCDQLFEVGSSALRGRGDVFNAVFAMVQECHLLLVLRRTEDAHAHCVATASQRSVLLGVLPVTNISLWSGLAASQLVDETTDAERRQQLLGELDDAVALWTDFSASCAENFEVGRELLQGEQARHRGDAHQAAGHFERAVARARREGLLPYGAMAYQLAMELHHRSGHAQAAGFYAREMVETYRQWGAPALAEYLLEYYAPLMASSPPLRADAGRMSTRSDATIPSTATRTTRQTMSWTHTGDSGLDTESVFRAAKALATELDVERIVGRLMELVLENVGAQRGALFLFDDEEKALRLRARLDAVAGTIETGVHVIRSVVDDVPMPLVEHALRSRATLVVADLDADPRFSLSPTRTGSALVAPLVNKQRMMGVLALAHDEPETFSDGRSTVVEILASLSAIAIENAKLYGALRSASYDLERANAGLESEVAARTAELNQALQDLWGEMDLARKIQTVLLPPDEETPAIEFAGLMQAAEKVGGDYYDTFELDHQRWVLIGDVSGHGVSAGLIMMMVQTAVRALTTAASMSGEALTPAKLLSRVNRAVWTNLEKIGGGQFMTMTALCVEGHVVRHAGLHLDLIVYRAETRRVERIPTRGVWLGVVPDIDALNSDGAFALEVGDVVIACTDGLTEAKDAAGARVSSDFLASRVEGIMSADPHRTCGAIAREVAATVADLEVDDDVSVVVFRRPFRATGELRREERIDIRRVP